MVQRNRDPTFSNVWLHSNRNLDNDGQSGGFKVFAWTILHVTHFFKYFLTVCLPRIIKNFVSNKFRVALSPLWQHFSWYFKISKSVNKEWLRNKIGFFYHDLMSPKNRILILNIKYHFHLHIDLKNVLTFHNWTLFILQP